MIWTSLAAIAFMVATAGATESWERWLVGFGHDVFQYPQWIKDQRDKCVCTRTGSTIKCTQPKMAAADELTWCTAKQFLIDHMPQFDKDYMPPSVSIDGNSMFDDNIAFTLMANNASAFASKIPLHLRLAYTLPYASYHEARVNWRPLFFAKFFQLVQTASTTHEAISMLVAPDVFANWTAHVWADYPHHDGQSDYNIQWTSSTGPPIINPLAFAAYGYSSCTGYSTMLTYIARAVGIPARQVGTPCWNSEFMGTDFRGLAKDNANVSLCWHGGLGSADGATGGGFLNNHNWVEYWDDEDQEWVFLNVPPGTAEPNQGLCNFNKDTGCDYDAKTGCSAVSGGPAAAMQDHDIFAVSWSDGNRELDGGEVIDVANLKLSNGEEVSPLVWSPRLTSPLGVPIARTSLRVVNRTDFYRCHAPKPKTTAATVTEEA